MLTYIHIQNFVIVKSLSLDFQNGLHVLTGETGAGKSIWIDAIEIGLGGKVDSAMIYPGETKCDITVCFDLSHQPEAKKWLSENDFQIEDECIIRRTIDAEKPSRTTINGMPIPQPLIRTFAQTILCIHGQHQHQRLLKSDEQRELLDRYADHETLLVEIESLDSDWKKIDRQMQSLSQRLQNKNSDLTLWQYQLEELTALNVEKNEYDTLFLQFQQLQHGKQFAGALQEALNLLSHEENPAANHLAQLALQKLNLIQIQDKKLDTVRELLQTATIHLEEAVDGLQQYCMNIEVDSDQLAASEARLAILQDTARKHHVDPTQLYDVAQSLQQKISILTKSDEMMAEFEAQKQSLEKKYQTRAKALTVKREKAAKKLSGEITAHMQTLGMQGGLFKIDFQKNNTPVNHTGNESVHFLIATNPGQTPHDLSQIVSGGELSRLSLIIQMLTARKKNTPTFIFDEVDVGIGGKTAELVGKLLRNLSQQAQVLCVTHLAQVAANAHHHFLAEKITDGKNTSTMIKLLNKTEQTKELARMLSGATITEKSISHAKELLALLQ